MAKITIIGAGAMGSALTKPLADNDNDVRLWGSPLDDDIIKALKAGQDHPVHKYPLPKNVKAFYHYELSEALKDAEVVIMAITSDAVGSVFEKVVPYLHSGILMGCVTKGFDYDKNKNIALLPTILSEKLPDELAKTLNFVFIAGPCKAVEVLWDVPTSVTYACSNIDAAAKLQALAATDVYNVDITDDVIGTEICAAMKNVYSVGLGMAEGFGKQKKGFHHKDTKGTLFTYAVAEMGIFSKASGGTLGPVLGLPGVGDLELTGEAGRNRTFGEAIGSGLSIEEAVSKMKEEHITVEGYPATKLGYLLMKNLEEKGKIKSSDMPLLCGLYSILYDNAPCYSTIKKLVKSCTATNISNKKI